MLKFIQTGKMDNVLIQLTRIWTYLTGWDTNERGEIDTL